MRLRRATWSTAILPAAVGSFAVAACWSPAASAAPYKVKLCATNPPPLTVVNDRSKNLDLVEQTCGGPDELLHQEATIEGPGVPLPDLIIRGTRSWKITAPPGTSIIGLHLTRHYFGTWFAEQAAWELRSTGTLGGAGVFLGRRESINDSHGDFTNPPDVTEDIDILSTVGAGLPFIFSVFGCSKPAGGTEPCGSFRHYGVDIRHLEATFDDTSPPAAPTLGGSLLDAGPVFGSRTLTVASSDVGAGILYFEATVDGKFAGGHFFCTPPFTDPRPCPANFSEEIPVNASAFGPGQHTVTASVRDGAEQITTSTATFTVPNPPMNTGPPTLSGEARVGGLLSATPGQWDTSPTLTYTWLRCPASVNAPDASKCQPIDGTISEPLYAPVAADVGKRVMVKVTATDDGGPTSAFSAPTAPVAGRGATDTTAPVLSRVSLSPKRLRPAARAKPRHSTLRFSSSEAGMLSVAIFRGKAKRPLVTLTRAIGIGKGRVPLPARIKGKRLRPSRYRLVVSARDAAGNVSKPVRLALTVLPGS